MIEVFKTNVKDQEQAARLVAKIGETFAGYLANFDLDDCDKVLRVECKNGFIQPDIVIDLLRNSGCDAEILPDKILSLN